MDTTNHVLPKTHTSIRQDISGTPVTLAEGYSSVELIVTETMEVDSYGLTHGGFIFGMADYAAMLAVNHPNVVLARADVYFIKPVMTGNVLNASGKITSKEGMRNIVEVKITRGDEEVFSGTFHCLITDTHVLEKRT